MLIDELAQRREEKEAMLSRNNIGKKHKQADFQKEFVCVIMVTLSKRENQ